MRPATHRIRLAGSYDPGTEVDDLHRFEVTMEFDSLGMELQEVLDRVRDFLVANTYPLGNRSLSLVERTK